MAKDPDQRYPSAGALADAARVALTHTPLGTGPTPQAQTKQITVTDHRHSANHPAGRSHDGPRDPRRVPPGSRPPGRAGPPASASKAKKPARIIIILMFVVGLSITVWNVFVPSVVPNPPSTPSVPDVPVSDRPIIQNAVGPPPWTIEGQGYRYEITSVSHERVSPGPGSENSTPSLVIRGFVTRTEPLNLTAMRYTVRNQDDAELKQASGEIWEDNPTFGQRLPIELRVHDSSPQAAQLKITISDFFVKNGGLILQGIPVPVG